MTTHKKKDPAEPLAPPDHIVQRPGDIEPTKELPDAGVALYKDRAGPERSRVVSEGAGYSGHVAKMAREAAGLPPLEES